MDDDDDDDDDTLSHQFINHNQSINQINRPPQRRTRAREEVKTLDILQTLDILHGAIEARQEWERDQAVARLGNSRTVGREVGRKETGAV